MNAKLKTDALDLTSLLNGLVFFSPVSLLVRTTAGISLSQFFILQAIMATMVLLTEIPLGKLTDRIGYKSTLVLYQIALLISRTCLLLAHVSCNYSLFILQAILEGTAASFSSGTQSGYIYIMFSKEHYAEKSAHVANYGTVGFFASTLAYAVLYTLIGIKGLLLATIAANLVAVFTSLKIPKETVQPRSETRQKKNIPYPQLFQQKKIWMLLMILAALNIGRILINFFYAEKLQLCGINETWRGRKRKAATSWGRFYHRLFQYRAELPPGRLTYRHCGGGHCPADYLHQRQEREEIPPRDRIRFGALGRG